MQITLEAILVFVVIATALFIWFIVWFALLTTLIDLVREYLEIQRTPAFH